jgi:NADH dehydrogenase (ubiquinone) Fe-S protein 1
LQDQSVRYGSGKPLLNIDRSRFTEVVGKRATENKNFGPLVKTVMTRCIHCTRCVRFANEVAGATELGTSGRGNDMQIGTYIEKTISSEMSGNMIDLCPVGALTSKPYAFTARPWELKNTESVDVMDAVGSNIRIDTRGSEVMRILPRINDDINEEWISDKTRFAYDGLRTQRLTVPLVKKNGEFVEATWPEVLERVASEINKVGGNEMAVVAGQMTDTETLVSVKDLFNKLNSENLFIENSIDIPAGTSDIKSNYIFNSSINGIESADVLLIVGSNPRHEAAIINTRIRKAYLRNGLEIGVIGQLPDLNYEVEHIGSSLKDFNKLSEDKHLFMKKLKNAKRPMILVGSSVFEYGVGEAENVLKNVSKIVETLTKTCEADWNIYNMLQRVDLI